MNAQAPTDHVLEQILDKARAARDGHFDVLSTGEKLTVALVLNQPELLSKMGTRWPRPSSASAPSGWPRCQKRHAYWSMRWSWPRKRRQSNKPGNGTAAGWISGYD